MRHKDRVGKVFAFAANTATSGVKDGVEKNSTSAAYIERAGHEYVAHSVTPKEYDTFVDQISKMWAEQPNWSDAQLKAVDTPILVADGDHDEAIKREHTEYIAAMIPHAGLLILPDTSRFAFLQDPRRFNSANCTSWGTSRDWPDWERLLRGQKLTFWQGLITAESGHSIQRCSVTVRKISPARCDVSGFVGAKAPRAVCLLKLRGRHIFIYFLEGVDRPREDIADAALSLRPAIRGYA
jgi:hypothetical protein